MTLKPKTVRRLTLAAAVLSIVAGGALVVLALGHWQINRRGARLREAGMAAFERAQYADAGQALGDYLRRGPDDADALLAYARARERVAEPGDRHIDEAIGAYERYLVLRPDARDVGAALLRLYNRAGQFRSARDAAVRLRAGPVESAGPADAGILHEEAAALLALESLDDHLGRIATRLIQLDPASLDAHLVYTAWLVGTGRSAEAAAYAAELRASHPGDPRFALLALMMPTPGEVGAGAATDRLADLSRLAGLDPVTGARESSIEYPDALFVRQLVEVFDRLKAHERALTVLEDASARYEEPRLRAEFVRRAWQSGRYEAVVASPRIPVPSSHPAWAPVLGIKGLALLAMGREDEAEEVVATLGQPANPAPAHAWSAVVGALARADRMEPAQVIAVMRRAAETCPSEPIFRYFLGESLAAAALNREARAEWVEAAASPLSVGWPAPWIREAETLLADGQPGPAADAAAAALEIAPRSVEAGIVWLLSHTAVLDSGGRARVSAADLIGRVDAALAELDRSEDLAAAAGHRDRLLPARIALLVRLGRHEEAAAAGHAALEVAGPAALDAIAAMSESRGLGVDDLCRERAAVLYRARATESGAPMRLRLRAVEALLLADDAGAPAALAAVEADCRRSLERESDTADTHVCFGAALELAGDIAGAVEAYARAAGQPAPSAARSEASLRLAAALSRAGPTQNLARAQSLAAAALETLRFPDALNVLAQVELASGNREAAIKAYRTALESSPGAPDPAQGLASLLATGAPAHRRDAAAILARLDIAARMTGGLSPRQRKQLAGLRQATESDKQ